MLSVMIVDDDINMRMILRKSIKTYEGLEVIGEAADGQEALVIASTEEVDIALMDVDMPGLSGIETAKQMLDIHPKCAIVFITAHDDYMSDAFEMFAFDYIVKPFRLERLHKTIEKLIEQKSLFVQKDKELSSMFSEELLFKVKDGMVIIKKEEIIMVERENRQTVIVTSHGEFIINKTLQEIEELLGNKSFLRSHKSYIIRIEAIEALKVYGRWTYVVKLKGTKHDALLTKENAKVLKSMFNEIE